MRGHAAAWAPAGQAAASGGESARSAAGTASEEEHEDEDRAVALVVMTLLLLAPGLVLAGAAVVSEAAATCTRLSPDISAQSAHVQPALRMHTVMAAVAPPLTAAGFSGGELATPLPAGGVAIALAGGGVCSNSGTNVSNVRY